VDPKKPVSTYAYTITETLPHNDTAFTQGLFISDGMLYEGTGGKGTSYLRKMELATGKVLQEQKLADDLFGEGITRLGDRIYQLTWKAGKGFVYDAESFKRVGSFAYKGEGWGLTNDGEQLIVSDGTAVLRFIHPDTFEKSHSIQVRERGRALPNLNELEYINGKIWANVWRREAIAVIDPVSGRVEAWLNLRKLDAGNKDHDVLNGIAWDADAGKLYVTGKQWSRLYQLEVEEPSVP
jgi:glutamine cyclotransferase